ncbi:MAG: hypothetical protein JO325_09805 [Solirubrobacterales bacterium]|nr:hypothetical protein [Solirubrobacterales bacterium]
MSSEKPLTVRRLALPVALAAFAATGCGAVNVHPSTPASSPRLVSRGQVDSPLTNIHNHLACMLGAHLNVHVVSPIKLQVDAAPGGPTVMFTPTAGAAQAAQIDGSAQGAEAIGPALLYPNQGSPGELTSIEDCLDQGVQG